MARVAIYTRVSTGGQTTANQLRELRAVAKREGHKVTAEFTDEGISGAKGRDQRPGLNNLLDGVMRRDFDKVLAWSVDGPTYRAIIHHPTIRFTEAWLGNNTIISGSLDVDWIRTAHRPSSAAR
jgi:hypothetical protein